MADRRVPTPHAEHDLELVARIAAGDVAAHEAVLARDLVAGCGECAALVDDLRAIAAAARELGPAVARAASVRAPRDFRLTADDAARLRPGGLGGLWRRLTGAMPVSRGLGGALATLGLVGVLVSAGLPTFMTASTTEPVDDARLNAEGHAGGASPAASQGAAWSLDMATDVAAAAPEATEPAQATAANDVPTPPTERERSSVTTPLLVASLLLFAGGLVLLLASSLRRRAGP